MRELGGVKSLVPGSKVSFYYEPDEKGGKAKQVVVEETVQDVEEVREVCLVYAGHEQTKLTKVQTGIVKVTLHCQALPK